VTIRVSDVPNNPYQPLRPGNPYEGGPAKYCPACGAGLVAQAVICPNCGSPTGTPFSGGKSKTAAVLLAVFLGPWTWLYTYRRNAWKFWVGLVGGVGGIVLALTVAAAFAVTVNQGYYHYYQFNSSSLPAVAIFFIVFGYLVPFGVWIWSIVDVAVAPPSFYLNYPHG
jgi:hypothetical protein